MKILVWCAHNISHGGARLLANLIPGIARQDDIELIRIVISPETGFKERIDISAYSNIQIVYFSGMIDSPLGQEYTNDCDVIYFNWPHGPEFMSVNRPSVCTFQDTILLDLADLFISTGIVSAEGLNHYRNMSASWMKNVSNIVVSSEYVKSRLISHFGDHCQSATVIPHAILPDNTPLTDISESAISLPDEYFVCATNVSPHKNYHTLLQAYAMFPHRKKIPLVLFGEGTEKLNHPSYNHHLETGMIINDDFYALGSISDQDVIPIIRNAKALIMPSFAEGGGSYPVEEALRTGTPVLCSDIPVMREHLLNRSAHICWFNPQAPDSIVEALDDMLTHYSDYKESTIRGMSDTSETWDDIAKKYINAFRGAYLTFWKER